MFLVVLLLYLFLDTRVALWAAQGIPFCFLVLFIFMNYYGMTLNLLSMFAMLLVLGIVVDDAIVVGENIYRYYQMGYAIKEAAVMGTNEVMLPVLAAVLTNIASFIPLIFMTGLMGRFMTAIPIVVVVVFTASLLEAFFLLPSHLVEFGMSKRSEKTKLSRKLDSFWDWFEQVRNSYGRLLEKLVKRRYLVISGLVGLMIVTIVFGMLTMRVVFQEKGISEKFTISITMPVDSSLEQTEAVADRMEALIRERPADEIAAVITQDRQHVEPLHGQDGRLYRRGPGGAYRARVQGGRGRAIINDLRKQTDEIPGVMSIRYQEQAKGPARQARLSRWRSRGEDFDTLRKMAGDLRIN